MCHTRVTSPKMVGDASLDCWDSFLTANLVIPYKHKILHTAQVVTERSEVQHKNVLKAYECGCTISFDKITYEIYKLNFLLILVITFITILMVAALISYCRRKLNKTPHGLTGSCHQTGGHMCANCASLANSGKVVRPRSYAKEIKDAHTPKN